MAPLQKRGKIVTLHSVNELLNLYNPRPPSVIPSVARNLPFSCRHPRDLIAPLPCACGRGCAAVPKSSWGRGLFERSEFRSPHSRDWGKGTRRATPGRPWFWVLLPKQKDLVARGRNPASLSPCCHPRRLSPTFVIEDLNRESRVFLFVFVAAPSLVKARDMPHGATSRRLRAWLRRGPEINWGARTV